MSPIDPAALADALAFAAWAPFAAAVGWGFVIALCDREPALEPARAKSTKDLDAARDRRGVWVVR